jgi:hypothetical protein
VALGPKTYARGVQPDSDDDAWRAIVENYGERVRLDTGEDVDDRTVADGLDEDLRRDDEFLARSADLPPYDAREAADTGETGESPKPPEPTPAAAEERYVPPPPPPLPHVAPDRLVAWTGIFGSPVVLLVALVLGVGLPAWLGYLLVAGFVGGFIYLVVQMPRGPRDPWDDGAQV